MSDSDLTTRILTDREPGESKERFRTLFESAPIGIADHSADGRLVAEKRQRAFYELGHRLSAAASEESAARVILGIADQLCGWDACYLHLYDEKDQILPVLTIDTVEGERTEFPPSAFTLAPSPMMRRISAEGPLLILREHPEDALEDLVPFGEKKRRSAALMYAPIHQGDKTIGVLSVQSYTPHAYGQADLDTLQALADHCGAALDRIGIAGRLHREEASHRALLQAVPDSMFRVRADGTLLDSKAATEDPALQVLHRSRGLRLDEVWPAPLATQTMGCVERALRTGTPQRFEFQPDTPEAFRQYETRVVRSGEEEVLIIIRDCSEQVRLQREVLSICSHERQRIGKDLHDDLCQLLTGLGYLAQSVQTRLAPTGAEPTPPCPQCASAASTAGQIVNLANQALSWARKFSRELASEGLERGGLFPALTDLAGTLGQLFRIACSVKWDPDIRFANRVVEEHLYRITQEAITNAVRHGKAGRITVDFTTQAATVVLTIQDDGVGLAEPAGSSPGMGLRIMRYRARQIGADFCIQASPEGGTAVICRIPPAPAATEEEAEHDETERDEGKICETVQAKGQDLPA